MKNVTVSMSDEAFVRARRKAAAAGQSLSAIVRDLLEKFGSEETEFERLHKLERALRELPHDDVSGLDSHSWSREDIHDRSKANW